MANDFKSSDELDKNAREKRDAEKKITPIRELLKMKKKEQPFLLDRMIPENAITAITSETGMGKSVFALKIAKHIATGETLFNEFKAKKKKVLLIDLEMNEYDMIERSQTIVSKDVDIDFIYQQNFLIDNEYDFEWLVEVVKKNDYGLVIFDTFTEIHSKIENSVDEIKQISQKFLELIRKTNTTVLYLHHHYKTRGGERSKSRGSTDIRAKLSSHLSIESTEGKTIEDWDKVQIILRQEKARLMRKFKKIAFDYFYNPTTKRTEWKYKGEIDLQAQAIDRAKEFIMKHLEKGEIDIKGFMAEIEKQGLDLGDNAVRKACKGLEDSEKIFVRKGTGKQHNANLYSLTEKDQSEQMSF